MAAKNHGTFTKTINGRQYTQVAHTAADAVKFVFDGWKQLDDNTAKAVTARPRADSKTK